MHFIFPQNYHFRFRLFGLFDYPTLFFNIAWFCFLFAFSNLFFNVLEVKIFICTTFFIPVFLLSFFGIH